MKSSALFRWSSVSILTRTSTWPLPLTNRVCVSPSATPQATSYGYGQLERWSRKLGEVRAFGVEGTGSYGAGLARFLTGRGFTVVEVNRPDRSTRYRKGKSDPTDAEMAARAVLAGVANATPKSGKGEIEMIRMMIRMLKSTKDSAVRARTQAVNQMKALVVTAPAGLRETLDGLTATALAARCKSLRPGRLEDPTAAEVDPGNWTVSVFDVKSVAGM